MTLPVYEMVIDDNPQSDIEVSFIALVDKPAIEKNFMAFKDMKLDFKTDTEKMIISGPAMVADTLIYRRDENGEYNVFFSKDTIESIALKFFKKDYQKNINLFHDPNLPAEGVTVFESFISDKSRNIPAMQGYEDLPDGTWFISAKVENPDIWQKIKDGTVKGFSVEGYFATAKVKKQEAHEKVFDILNATFNQEGHLRLDKTSIMSKVKDMVANFKKQFFDVTPPPVTPPVTPPIEKKFSDYTLDNGTAISIDNLAVGGMCMVNGAPCPPGDYTLQDGTKITIGDGGVISAVTQAQMSQEQQMQKIQDAVKKFAVGTPEERIANIEIVARALMEYSFGWQIREQQTKALTDQAINIYKTKFEALDKDKPEQAKKITALETLVENQNKVIKELFAIVEVIANEPTGTGVESTRQQFLKKFNDDKESRLKTLAENLAKLKKAS